MSDLKTKSPKKKKSAEASGLSRRDFVAKAGLVVAAGLPLRAFASDKPAPKATSTSEVEWNLVSAFPRDLPGYHSSMVRMIDAVKEMSGGKFKISLFPAGEKCKAFDSFDFVSKGSAHVGFGVPYYWRAKNEAFQFFGAVPFGLTAREMYAWVNYGGAKSLADELYGAHNLLYFAASNSGVQMGGWFNKEIKSVADFKGMRIRYPAWSGDCLKHFGADVVTIPAGEIYAAIKAGKLDAVEWVGPWNDYSLKLHEVAKFYYWPGWHEPGTLNDIFVHKPAFEALSAENKAIFKYAVKTTQIDMMSELDAKNNEYLSLLQGRHKIQLRRFDDATLKELSKVSERLFEEAAAKDGLTKRILESFKKFREEAMAWSEISEEGYLAARATALR